jgi:hypothetical protein
LISLNKDCNTTIEVKSGKIKVGDPVLHSGAVVALKADVEPGVKIAAVSSSIKPSVILYSGDIHDMSNYTKVVFSEYEGFEVFSCEIYNKKLNVCLVKTI